MSPDVAAFLRNMLASSTLNVGAVDFAEAAALAAKSLAQLDAIIEGHADG